MKKVKITVLKTTLDTELAAEYGVEVYPHYLDLCDSKSVTKCVEDVIAHFGKIDILVNSGGTGGSGDPATMTDEQWAHVVDTDLTGLFYLCRDVARPTTMAASSTSLPSTASSPERTSGPHRTALPRAACT